MMGLGRGPHHHDLSVNILRRVMSCHSHVKGIFELLLCQRAGRLLLVGYASPPTDDGFLEAC